MILFEDNHLLVANKPAGLLTQPDHTSRDSLEDQLKRLIKKRDEKPGNVFLHAVHRIDRPVSGIVCFAKSQKALSRLTKAVRDRETKKVYWALVEGTPQGGTLEHHLIHEGHAARVDPNGKLARLHYEVVRPEAKSLIRIELETGRYHQIRIQMASTGHPIVGDFKYGSSTPFKENSIALHHGELTLMHPTLKTPHTFSSAPAFISE